MNPTDNPRLGAPTDPPRNPDQRRWKYYPLQNQQLGQQLPIGGNCIEVRDCLGNLTIVTNTGDKDIWKKGEIGRFDNPFTSLTITSDAPGDAPILSVGYGLKWNPSAVSDNSPDLALFFDTQMGDSVVIPLATRYGMARISIGTDNGFTDSNLQLILNTGTGTPWGTDEVPVIYDGFKQPMLVKRIGFNSFLVQGLKQGQSNDCFLDLQGINKITINNLGPARFGIDISITDQPMILGDFIPPGVNSALDITVAVSTTTSVFYRKPPNAKGMMIYYFDTTLVDPAALINVYVRPTDEDGNNMIPSPSPIFLNMTNTPQYGSEVTENTGLAQMMPDITYMVMPQFFFLDFVDTVGTGDSHIQYRLEWTK